MKFKNKFKKVIAMALVLTCLPISISADQSQGKDEGFTIRPTAPKDTVPREEEIDTTKPMSEIVGKFYTKLNSGNYDGGKQDKYSTKDGQGNKNGSSGANGAAGDIGTEELQKVLNNMVDQRTPVPNGKACKGTRKDLDDLITYAKSKIASDKTGNYFWGGENPDVPWKRGKNNPDGIIDTTKGVDCSGFVKVCYEHVGIKFNGIRTTSAYLPSLGVKVSYEEARPGDVILLGSSTNPNSNVCHTGIYLGDNKCINSKGDRYNCYEGVTISTIEKNEKGGMKMGGQAVLAVKRVIAVTDFSSPTGGNNGGGNGSNKNGGSVGSPKKVKLDGYGANLGVKFDVGSKVTIGINAGHQAQASGDVTSGTSVQSDSHMYKNKPEYELNLMVAEKLKSALLKNGYNVVMTRTSNDVQIDNVERGKMFTDAKVNAAIGIHFDSAESGVNGHGFSYVMANSKKGQSWETEAHNLFNKIKTKLEASQSGIKSRGEVYGDYKGFDACSVPYFYFEMGYISAKDGLDNTDISKGVLSADYWDKFCNAAVEAIKEQYPLS